MLRVETIAVACSLPQFVIVQGLLASYQGWQLFDVEEFSERQWIDESTEATPESIESLLSLLLDIKIHE